MTDTAPRNGNAGLISCELSIGGGRVGDGPADSPLVPYAISGLKVTWGRDSTVDQPSASTCAFTLIDLPGDSTFMKLVRTGRAVDVAAGATIYPEPSISTHSDPSWTSFATGAALPVKATGATVTAGDLVGRHAALIRPGLADSAIVAVPPAPFVPPGTAPDAWDAVPAVHAGQRWRIAVAVRAPAGSTVRLDPILYAGPYAAAGRVVAWDTPAPAVLVGADVWVTVGGYVTNTATGWLGVQLTIYPTGTRWDVAPAAWTWDTAPNLTWDQLGDVWVDDVQLLAPAAGVLRRVSVFSGRITDAAARYDKRVGGAVVDVTATDFTADLENRNVGDDPWPAERADARIRRVLALVAPTIPLIADTRPAALTMSRQDVDRRPALSLLQTVANSTDAVLRAAVHPVTGPYLRLEDPAGRSSLLRLVVGAGGLIEIAAAPPPADSTWLAAADIDLDPVRWEQDTGDVVAIADVTWQEQTSPQLTERTVSATDAALRQVVGERSVKLSSQLTNAVDAGLIAQQLLARLADTNWRISGLLVDTRTLDLVPDLIDRVVTLLDGTARIGRPLQVTGIPQWTPSPAGALGLYLEGGVLQYIDGCWSIEIDGSTPSGLGRSATWDEAPAGWTWDQFSPGITWDDLIGVSV